MDLIQPFVSNWCYFNELHIHCCLDGRRYTYTYSLPIMVIGSVGSATAPTIYSLLFWRFVQSLGASPGMVLGAGVIGDIYKLEERGRGMAIFLAVSDT